MIGTIFGKEFLEHLRSQKFVLCFLLCFTLIPLSNVMMWRDYTKRLEDYTLTLPKKGQVRACRRPPVLSIYVKGLGENMDRSFDLPFPPSNLIFPTSRHTKVNLLGALSPTPDFAYLVKVVMSLLAMLFAFDLICGEKAMGTLRLMLSNTVPRSSILLGKILGGLAALFAPFVGAFLLGLILLHFLPGVSFSAEDWARIGTLFLGSAIYMGVFFFLALLVSCLTRMPKSSIVICLFFWAILVFAVPNIGGLVARGISPFASPQRLEEQKFQAGREIGFRKAQRKESGGVEAINRRIAQIENAYRNKLDQYVEASKKVCRLSPAASFVYFSSTIVGSGFEDERVLKQAILRYRDAALAGDRYKSGEVRFSYRGLTLSESLSYVFLDLMLMFLFGALCFAVAYLLFLRYDVR